MLILIIGAVMMLGVSIFIHELGHLLCGMLVGVKAKIFSIGYGKGIWKKKINGTIYQLTAIPIGGYVMFKGDQYGRGIKGRPGELLSTPPLKRMVPILGGPLFNLIMGFLLFFFLALAGDDSPSNRIFIDESIYKYSPAYKSGLRSGDRILKINGQATKNFEEVSTQIAFSAGAEITLDYERDGQTNSIKVLPDLSSAGGRPSIGIEPAGKRNVQVSFTYGEQFRHWLAKNLSLSDKQKDELPFKNQQEQKLPLAINYLKDGDVILEVEGEKISTVGELQNKLGQHQNQTVKVKLMRKLYPLITPWAEEEKMVEVPVREAFVLEFFSLKDKSYKSFSIKNFSLASYDPELGKKLKNIKINGKPFDSFASIKDYLATITEKKVDLSVGTLEYQTKFQIRPIGILGFRPEMRYNWETMEQGTGFVEALKIASDKVYQSVAISVKSFKMLFTGMISPKESMAGPIGIVQYASLSLEYGWAMYFDFVAKVSIMLMFMNLLPIPVADGGHLVLYLYEAIAGRPMPGKVVLAMFRLGFIFLLLLGLFVSFNDVARLFR